MTIPESYLERGHRALLSDKIQVWTQKCAVQKASVDVNISYY